MRTMVILALTASFISVGIASYTGGYYYGHKSRSVIIRYNDVSRKLPELLEQAGIEVTPEQLNKLNHVFIKEKEKIGFK